MIQTEMKTEWSFGHVICVLPLLGVDTALYV
jgi:hypothetical protein